MAEQDEPLYPPDPPGGQGGGLRIDPSHTRQHLQLMERMVRLGTLSPEQMQEIRDEAFIILRKSPKERDKVAALRTLAALERNDIKKLELALTASGVVRGRGAGVIEQQNNQFNVGGATAAEIVAELRRSCSIDELKAMRENTDDHRDA